MRSGLPEIILIVTLVSVLAKTILLPHAYKRLAPVVFLIVICSILAILLLNLKPEICGLFNNWMVIDAFGNHFKSIVTCIALLFCLILLISARHNSFDSELYFFFILQVTIVFLSASINNFIGIALLLILNIICFHALLSVQLGMNQLVPQLAKILKTDWISLIAMLSGMALIKGFTGSFVLNGLGNKIATTTDPLVEGFIWLLVLLGFRRTITCFFNWRELLEIYEKSSKVNSILCTVLTPMAELAILIRLKVTAFPAGVTSDAWNLVVLTASFGLLLTGSFAAKNAKDSIQYLLYSGFSNMAFILMGLILPGSLGIIYILIMLIAHSLSLIGILMGLVEPDNSQLVIRPTLWSIFFLLNYLGFPGLLGFIPRVLFLTAFGTSRYLNYPILAFFVVNYGILLYLAFQHTQQDIHHMIITRKFWQEKSVLVFGQVGIMLFLVITGIYWQPLLKFLQSACVFFQP